MAERWSDYELDILYKFYETERREFVQRLIPNRKWKYIWTKASKLGLKRHNTYSNGSEKKNILDFSIIDSEEKAYVLGFLGADGNIHHPKNGNRSWVTSIHLAKKDTDHLSKLVKIISPESFVRPKKDGMVQFSIADNQLATQLISHNLIPNKTGRLLPPESLPKGLVKHYIRGYMDGDGYVGISCNLIHCIIAGNPEILEFIRQEFKKIYNNGCHVTKQKTVHVLHYTGTTALNFCQYIYKGASIYMERKYQRVKEFL